MENNANAITAIPTPTQVRKANEKLVANVATVFDARNIKTFADVQDFYQVKQNLNELTDLSLCRVFYDCKVKNLWQADEMVKKLKLKSFESWAIYYFGLQKSSIENYVFLGRFVKSNGQMDILPRVNGEYENISYKYTALLEIVRLCGKGLKGKREEIEKARIERINALAENGYINPNITSKKDVQQAVEKGLRELYAQEIKPTTDESKPTTDESKPTTDESKPTTDESKPTTDESKPTTDESKPTPAQMSRYAINELVKAFRTFNPNDIEISVFNSHIKAIDYIIDHIEKGERMVEPTENE